jgi:ribosomal protein S18 acetylase RimI-like enzyme
MIRRLEWDSTHFQRRIGRLEGDAPEVSADFDCLYFLAAAGDVRGRERALELGFIEMGDRVELISNSLQVGPCAGVRAARREDVDRLAAIEFPGTRFSLDPHFARERVAALYRGWIEKLITTTLVAMEGSAIAGYVACEAEESRMRIGLIAVAENCRGRGVGGTLLHAAGHFASERRIGELTVTTQGSNGAALGLYRRHGFREVARGTWFHWWQE